MASKWYYTRGGDRHGPVDSQVLRKLAHAGHLMQDDFVWKEGMAEWKRADKIRGLEFQPKKGMRTVPALGDAWYYIVNGIQHGPVDTETLTHYAASGKLHPEDLLWKEGMTEWLPAKNVNRLSFVVPPPIVTQQSNEQDILTGPARQGTHESTQDLQRKQRELSRTTGCANRAARSRRTKRHTRRKVHLLAWGSGICLLVMCSGLFEIVGNAISRPVASELNGKWRIVNSWRYPNKKQLSTESAGEVITIYQDKVNGIWKTVGKITGSKVDKDNDMFTAAATNIYNISHVFNADNTFTVINPFLFMANIAGVEKGEPAMSWEEMLMWGSWKTSGNVLYLEWSFTWKRREHIGRMTDALIFRKEFKRI